MKLESFWKQTLRRAKYKNKYLELKRKTFKLDKTKFLFTVSIFSVLNFPCHSGWDVLAIETNTFLLDQISTFVKEKKQKEVLKEKLSVLFFLLSLFWPLAVRNNYLLRYAEAGLKGRILHNVIVLLTQTFLSQIIFFHSAQPQSWLLCTRLKINSHLFATELYKLSISFSEIEEDWSDFHPQWILHL